MKKLARTLCTFILAFCLVFCCACASKKQSNTNNTSAGITTDNGSTDDGAGPDGTESDGTSSSDSQSSDSDGKDGKDEDKKDEDKDGDKDEDKDKDKSPVKPTVNTKIKNVILMIGDGMGKVHEEAARIKLGRELVWDGFDYIGDVKTRSLLTREDASEPTDSAAAATALATGIKAYNGTVAKSVGGTDLTTIMDIAHGKGKKTGVVTSDSLSGATPSGFSGHAATRSDEQAIITSQTKGTLDLLLGEDGNTESGVTNKAYSARKSDFTAKGYTFTTKKSDLTAANYDKRIVGAFPAIDPASINSGATRLPDLVTYSLDYLSQGENGFCLMIEGAKIDKKSHARNIGDMVKELIDFDECVGIVKEWMKDRDDTYVIVTADHETGGLELNKAVDQNNINRPTSAIWHESDHPSCGNHSPADVHYHAQGSDSPHHKEAIENTTIFRIMKEFVTGELTEEPELIDGEIRIADKIYSPLAVPDSVSVGGGTAAFEYDKTNDVLNVTLSGVSISTADYPLYVWDQDVCLTLVGSNTFTRSSGKCVRVMDGKLTVKGTGTLTVNSDFYVYGDYTQDGGTVKVNGSGSQDAMCVYGETDINGGTLEIKYTGDTEKSGLLTCGANINGGALKADGFKYGIYVIGNMNIYGGAVTTLNTSEAGIGVYDGAHSANLVINGGNINITSDKYGLAIGTSSAASSCRIDICRDLKAGAEPPTINIDAQTGAIRAYNMDIYGGTINLKIHSGGTDAVKMYNWLTFENATMTIERTGSYYAGINLSSGAGARFNSGSITVKNFGNGIDASGGIDYAPSNIGTTFDFVNCTKGIYAG